MNLLTRSVVEKLDTRTAEIEFSRGKISVSPAYAGTGTLRFPITFTPYKTVTVEAVAKRFGPESGRATMGIELKRRGQLMCRDTETGGVLLDGENYREYKLRYFIPFGADEAYVTLNIERGATVSLLGLTAETGAYAGEEEESPVCIADGGLSAYAPKNTMPAYLAAMRAGFRRIIVDVGLTADGEIVCSDGSVLSAVSDGEGLVRDKTLAELKALDFGMFSDSFYKNTRIATLGEVMMQFSGEGIIPYIRMHSEVFPVDVMLEKLAETPCGEIYFMTEHDALRKKIAEKNRNARFAFASGFYRSGDDRVTAERYEELRKDGVEIIPVINYPEELERFIKAGEKQMITSVYRPGRFGGN